MCCPTSCGQCGGVGCSAKGSECCTANVKATGVKCSTAKSAPCIIDTDTVDPDDDDSGDGNTREQQVDDMPGSWNDLFNLPHMICPDP